MNEIELFEKIEDAIHKGIYDELLDKTELKLKKLFSSYAVEEILALINRVIIFHNYNIDCKENDYSKYQRNKHMSLRILLSLPQYYYENISVHKNNHIINYDIVRNELIQIIVELQCIYYYYPYRNQKDFRFNSETQFYMNYFKSYYFDYPEIEFEEFKSFFEINTKLCGEVLEDDNFKESLDLMLYLQKIERNLKQEKILLNLLFSKDIKRMINAECLWLLYPVKVVKRICCCKRINFEKFIKKYAVDLENRNVTAVRMMDILTKQKDKRFILKTSKSIFFPRNYFWMYTLYDQIWRSTNISQKTDYGKTIKSEMHERELLKLLKRYFGENNVYANVQLKRAGRQYAEKDFVVLYENKVVSFEAKSNLLPEPNLDGVNSIDDIKSKCEECIRKAYDQSLEVKQKVIDGTAVFYDSTKKKNNIVLDLRNSKINECIQIIVMYEEYLGIETNIEHICPEFDAWIIDMKNLKYILADTVGKGKFNTFVNYALKRKNAYGLVDVQSGEELRVYNLYKSMPVFFENDAKDIGISVTI